MSMILSQLIVPLTAAHLLGDFILQTDDDVKNKKKINVFIKHIVLVTSLSYLLTGYWEEYLIPLTVLITHTIIDLLKMAVKKDSFIVFATDQSSHFIVITGLAFYVHNVLNTRIMSESFWYQMLGTGYLKIMLLVIAIIFASKVSSILVVYLIKPFQTNSLSTGEKEIQNKTGRFVGQLERIIILLLFLADMPAVIGFLITAKSILRYGEIKNEKDKTLVEYILIGTLISFALGITIGFATREMLKVLN